MTMSGSLKSFIQELPKLELHIHLEGVFSEDLVEEFAKKAAVPLPRPKEKLFTYNGLAEFLELLDFNCSLVCDEENAEKLAYSYCAYAKSQNIVYSEVILNPTHWSSLHYSRLIPAVLEGFSKGAKDGLCDCYLLLSLLRTQSTETADETVDYLISHPHERLIGLSVDGNEAAAKSNERFAPLFAKAKKAGLHLTAHAGESSGPEGVEEALSLLGAERIDHGVRAIEDPLLTDRILKNRIPLNICFTSNLEVEENLYTEETHPLRQFYDAGVCVTVNTDDPMIMKDTLTYELERVADLYHWTEEDLIRLQHNAVRAAFCSEEKKASLRERIDGFQCRG